VQIFSREVFSLLPTVLDIFLSRNLYFLTMVGWENRSEKCALGQCGRKWYFARQKIEEND